MLRLSIRNTRKSAAFILVTTSNVRKGMWLPSFHHDSGSSGRHLGSLSTSLDRKKILGVQSELIGSGFLQSLPRMRTGEPWLISFSSGNHLTWTVQPVMFMGFFQLLFLMVRVLSLIKQVLKSSLLDSYNFSSLHGFPPIFMYLSVSLFLFPIASPYLTCKRKGYNP